MVMILDSRNVKLDLEALTFQRIPRSDRGVARDGPPSASQDSRSKVERIGFSATGNVAKDGLVTNLKHLPTM
jgi:hypothetical protein